MILFYLILYLILSYAKGKDASEPLAANSLEKNYPNLFEFLSAAAADWDFEYPTVSAALKDVWPDWEIQGPLIIDELRVLLENIEPYMDELQKELNVSVATADEMKSILTESIR